MMKRDILGGYVRIIDEFLDSAHFVDISVLFLLGATDPPRLLRAGPKKEKEELCGEDTSWCGRLE